MIENIFQQRRSDHIVKGLRECIFRKLDKEFLLFVYKNEAVGDYRDEVDESKEDNKLIQSALVYSLNQSAGIVWRLFKDNPTLESLLNRLLTYYPQQEPQDVKRDLGKFLQKLYTLNLIDFSLEASSESDSAFLTGFDGEKTKQTTSEGEKDYSPMQIEAIEVRQPVAFGSTVKSPAFPEACTC